MGPKTGKMVPQTDKLVRSRRVLHHAWSKVRASGTSSASDQTQKEIREFEEQSVRNLERIAAELRRGHFQFENERGIAPLKGHGKSGRRPMVIAPIANRVVRRSILDVLQGFEDRSGKLHGIPEIEKIISTPTSIGGNPKRGVPNGISLISAAVDSKSHYFARSDISNFFTRIPTAQVVEFVGRAVDNDAFMKLFESALQTNLCNQDELEERNLYKLFPDPEIGMAQGSALSALAGNIILREFDIRFNQRNMRCVRYIDDFIILGPNQRHVLKAFEVAQDFLRQLGMSAYTLEGEHYGKSGKAHSGSIWDGTDVLGYHVRGRKLTPSEKAQKALLQKIRDASDASTQEIKKARSGKKADYGALYYQTMAKISRICWGWSQAFKHANDINSLKTLDMRISEILDGYEASINRIIGSAPSIERRKVMGLHSLQSTCGVPLPN